MSLNEKSNRQIEIHDLIDDAITNAVARRGLVEKQEALLPLSDDEAAMIPGGLGVEETARVAVSLNPGIIAGFKPICPPIKPPIKPICPPPKPPIKPICPPILVGIIYSPKDDIPIA
jgi:hypothetical protein